MATAPGRAEAILDELDHGLGGGTTYAALFRRWEEQQWSATAIDLARDRVDWKALGPDRRRHLRWVLTQFFEGEEAVTVSLAPFVDAAPLAQQRVALAAQLADEARHAVLFHRVFDEVVGLGRPSLGESLAAIGPDVTPGFRLLFDGVLGAATERLRSDRSADALVRGVTAYHLLVEGTVALAGQRHVLDWLRREGLFPGMGEGFLHVTRDESRHVSLGVLLLRDAIAADPALSGAVQETVLEGIPAVLGTLEPPGGDPAYYEAFGFTREDVATWALDSLRRKLAAAGVVIEGL
ncbi:MAG: hypothetical protein OEW31_11235 [Thermoleophilia bacterium]|nr:hypothetical protein [Thermoleophilia bacterium]MDH4346897.1 hypothetical protein [Thermoleophilia bacterium]MDH5333989.1 hypothetical protein [Thermoleophilia bacterium]